ncbi:two-component system CitB family response regulator [Pseudoclavibacter chungangensis]|uniref:response regulator n=1 Tax=Pseudoclavibacter chungangensis TaxID=587635 RepID=UPI0015CC66DC|nr:response regulator [Pseudoclavibacter chungangensis]NYJ68150.1 two-component system CitB family response regulator [Pseudoclavibacter chungangensis]
MSADFRVLVVEDDFAVARLHRRYLDAIGGFEIVDSVLTIADAERALAHTAVDLVLLDMFLPDATGIDLLRRVRSAASTPLDVIMVTAAPEPELVRQALELGVVDYLLKPFRPEEFELRLRRYAQRRSRADALAAAALSQAQIDALQGRHPAPTQTASLPKGLSRTTAALVRDELRRLDGPVTAAELGELMGMSRVSARRYLEYFAGRDRVEVRPKYGDAGRPQHLYRWVGGDEL